MRMELYGCNVYCVQSLGLRENRLPDSAFTASSYSDDKHKAHNARLFDSNGWCAKTKDRNQWIKVDLGRESRVTYVGTWGANGSFITTYTMSYGLDGNTWADYKENNRIRVFRGNHNTGKTYYWSGVWHKLMLTFTARYIKIQPKSWSGRICGRIDLYGCKYECEGTVGIENGEIVDAAFTASSSLPNHPPKNSRLNYPDPNKAGWCAKTKSANEYLQIDLGKNMRIKKILTQGGPPGQFVKSFKIKYSYQQAGPVKWQTTKVFTGNSDSTTIVEHILKSEIKARYVELLPVSWNDIICVRWELYGCPEEVISATTAPPFSAEPSTPHPDLQYEGKVKLTQDWSDDLSDKSSQKYNQLKSSLIKQFSSIYSGNDVNSLAFNGVQILGFSKGSVIVKFIINFKWDLSQGANVTDKLKQAVKSGQLGTLQVDKNSLELVKVESGGGKTGKRTGKNGEEALNTGDKVAIGFCTILIIAALAVAGVYFYRKRTGKLMFKPQAFENPIHYSSKAYDMEE